jgi:hypothetical protein
MTREQRGANVTINDEENLDVIEQQGADGSRRVARTADALERLAPHPASN